ncbi:YegP family protein [Aquirufa antheringensis]
MFKIKLSVDFKPFWVFIAANGEIICSSETFNSIESCKNGIRSSKVSVSNSNFVIRMSHNLKYYFVQKANNNEILCQSQMYVTRQSCEHSVELIKRFGPIAQVVTI